MSTQTQPSSQTVTIEEQKPKVEEKPKSRPPSSEEVTIGFKSEASFMLLQRVAAMYANSKLVPENGFQGSIPDCAIAVNIAHRLGADPMMVMQNLYIVYGRPGWSAKFLIATFNENGKYEPLDYEWKGKEGQDDWGCRAFTTVKKTNKVLYGPWIDMKLVKAEGWYDRKDKKGDFCSKWRTIPELMFFYRAGAWFVNTHTPEISMGLRTAEEEFDIGPVMDEIIQKTSERLEQERQAVTAAIDSAPTKLDALVDAEKAKGNGQDKTIPEPKPQSAPPQAGKKPSADAAMAQAKENLKQRAEREGVKPKPAERQPENPSYAVGSDPPPSTDSMFE